MSKKPYKPTHLKLLEGNRGRREIPEEPKPRPVVPECPKDIDTQAKKCWKQLAPKLEQLGLLTEVDGFMFGCLCQIRSRILSFHKLMKSKDIREDEKALKDLQRAERQYYQLFRLYASEFGLTPRGRVGLAVRGFGENEGEDLLT